MNEWPMILCAGCIVLATFTIEGIAGFGSTVLALPFMAMLVGIDQAVPMLSTLGALFSVFVIARSWKHICLKTYGFIVLHVGLGVPVGLFLMDHLPRNGVMLLLAGFMFFVGLKGLREIVNKPAEKSAQAIPLKRFWARPVLFLGGIIQGAFSSGGPVVVMYASGALPEKSKFRVTLSSLWLTTNTIMIAKWTFSGTVWNPQLGRMILCALPFVVCGMLLGDHLHHKVDQKRFTVFVYSVLLIVALFLAGHLLLSWR